MPTIFNHDKLEFRKAKNPHANYGLQTAIPRLYTEGESNQLIFDMHLLPPGEYSFPYQFHYNAEEMFVIFSGSATLRTPHGLKIVGPEDIIFFEKGVSGAHQLFNHGTEPCIYLDIRTNMGFDVSEYPDSEKINVIPIRQIFKKESKVEYFEGEDNVNKVWEGLKQKDSNSRSES